MTEIAYKAWYFVPADTDPSTGRPVNSQPPLMTTMAVDGGSSLAFDLPGATGPVEVRITVTGISAEGRSDDAVVVLLGDRIDGRFEALDLAWERGQDGMNIVLHGTIARPKPIVKIHVATPPALVVTRVEFATP